MDFVERDVPVRGLWLRVRERGPRNGPACFLLHGWLDHRGSFDLLAPLLPGRTIAYDHRGHGDSGWGGAGAFYHFVEYLGDLDGLVREVSPDGLLRLVGHSLGGALALLYAASRPERIAHVTMLDAAPFFIAEDDVAVRHAGWFDDLANPRERRVLDSVEDARERLVRGNPDLTADVAQLLAAGAVAPHPDHPGKLAWKWDPLLRARSPLPYTREVLRRMIQSVRPPVLLLRAERSRLPDEHELRARFGSIPDLTIETMPGTGHHLHLERPDAVAERIQRAWRG